MNAMDDQSLDAAIKTAVESGLAY